MFAKDTQVGPEAKGVLLLSGGEADAKKRYQGRVAPEVPVLVPRARTSRDE